MFTFALRSTAALGLSLLSLSAMAQHTADDLAKAAANPVAAMISVPLQSNWDHGVGLNGKDTQFTLNVQPVIPFQLNKEWNLITRVILPLTKQPEMVAGQGSTSGIGDVVATAFFSPVDSKGLIWGVGPVVLLPTASKDSLGTGKWGAGPSGVALIEAGNFSYGALANHVWSFAGDSDRSKVSMSFLNPFLSYRLGGGWSTTLSPEYTYNWEAPSGQRTSFPIVAIVGKVFTVGNQPMSVGLGYKYFAQAPNDKPDNGVRLAVTFMFPK